MMKILTVTLLSVSALTLSACAANHNDHGKPDCQPQESASCHYNS